MDGAVHQQKVRKAVKSKEAAANDANESGLVFTGERIVPQADNCEPNFASRMYQEHIARYLFASQIVANKAVIDVGCGVGYGSQRLGELGAASVHAFDLSEDAIRHARLHYAHPNVHYEVANAESFTVDRKFDVAVCFELIEHVRNPRSVMKNIKKALGDDGVLIMSTPRALQEKRTHFHEHEFGLEEYVELIREFFGEVEIYVENNHFSSLVTKGRPAKLHNVICLKDQFDAALADVFIAVARSSVPLPAMKPAFALDDDAYVTMLERDVGILHKAERDLRERAEAIEAVRADEVAFKDAEINRLKGEYEALFRRSEEQAKKLWEADRRSSETASKDAEIKRLTKEYQALFNRFECQAQKLWKAEQSISGGTSKDAEIKRLKGEYEALFRRSEEQAQKLWEAEQVISDGAFKDVEIQRLTSEHKCLFSKVEQLSTKLWEAQQRNAQVESKEYEIERLTAEYRRLFARSEELSTKLWEAEQETSRHKAEVGSKILENEILTTECKMLGEAADDLSDQLRDSEMRYAGLQQEQTKLRQEIDLLTVRSTDADARRLEAYEFARLASQEAHGLRRELEILKRDIAAAIDSPSAVESSLEVHHDERHRDIVQAMERLFVGTEATHRMARDPIVDRIVRLSLQLEDESARASHLTREIRALQEFQREAEDWHRQLLRMRKSVSWRITAPLRGLRRLSRVRKPS